MKIIKDFFVKDWTIGEKTLLVSTCVLLGMIIGFLAAPIKKGIYCGNNNGNTNTNQYGTENNEQED